MSRILERADRHRRMKEVIFRQPFTTDKELADMFRVSIQTIRLDRASLGISQVRQRIKDMAEKAQEIVKSLGSKEVVGNILDISLGKSGASILEISQDMVFKKTDVAMGYHIYAQAESLAIAIIDAEVVLTGLVNMKFKRPARAGERLLAQAEVIRNKGNKYVVLVMTRAEGGELVFRGKIVVFALEGAGLGAGKGIRS